MSEITTGFLKADVYQGAHNDKKRGGVMNTRNNTFPEQQQGFSTADIIWATNSPELYTQLVEQRSWTPQEYGVWLGDSWVRLLLR